MNIFIAKVTFSNKDITVIGERSVQNVSLFAPVTCPFYLSKYWTVLGKVVRLGTPLTKSSSIILALRKARIKWRIVLSFTLFLTIEIICRDLLYQNTSQY
ncbi:hypothetical protein HMPREF0548_1943 [Lactobacillus ultunensis DSM 16047]|uniref:Uncharacterized protein n=1 Tax=Lactobacillus ultunensis DSM 16047 TaxID=525365 RepID=C2EQJ7_9LACO|nr:hypothetical protein HMPREF0548_1943 [Lactobacillus ultunensis DSM 16047]